MRGDDDAPIYRIELEFVAEDARRELAERVDVTDADRVQIRDQLAAWDRRGAWTHATLVALREREGEPAASVAESLGVARDVFKRRVRQLKELGLTQSLRVGYRLSPRGLVFLADHDAQA